MTTPDQPQRPDRDLDARLSGLLADAVSDVEPQDRLDEIRNRTKVIPMTARRPWLFAAGGAVVATAAVVTAIALAGGGLTDRSADAPPAGQQTSPTQDRGDDPTDDGSEEPTEPAPPASGPVPVYFVGDTPQGPRLFREFQQAEGASPLTTAAAASVGGHALDPDYRSLWPAGSEVVSAEVTGDVLTVDLTGAPRERPAGMSADDAALALQQVVYSAQAAHGQGRVGVQLLLDGQRSDTVLGEPTAEPLANAPVLQTLSLMQVNYPNEGDTVSGTFTADGANNGFEATVAWRIMRGDREVLAGAGIAEGWMGDQLYAWSVEVDVSGLEPGEYTFVASNDDPSGGEEGGGPHVDTRTIVVE